MNTRFHLSIVGAIACVAYSIAAPAAERTDYPLAPVRIVVPTGPGSLLDTIPRLIAQKLGEGWGQSVVVDNRPGAAQNVGAEVVAKAKNDGYTLLATPPGPLAISEWTFSKLAFQPSSFVPLSIVATMPCVIVARRDLPVSNLAELIALAKSNGGRVSYASPGAGSAPHFAMDRLGRQAGVVMLHVPYQGMGPAQRDVIAGHADVMLDLLGNALPHVTDGRLKALAVTTDRRLAELPDVPTVSETLAGFTHAEWFAMVAPPGTPQPLALKISEAIAQTLKRPDVAEQFRQLNVTPVGSSAAEAAAFIAQQRALWRDAIAASGFKSD